MPRGRMVLFDLDNTLVDRRAAFSRWAQRWCAQRHLGPDALTLLEELDADGMTSRQELFEVVRSRWGIRQGVDELVDSYHHDYPREFAPEPAVQEGLKELRSRAWRIGIVSNGFSTQHVKIRRAGLEPLVDAVAVSGEEGVAKPDRRIFERAARRCGVTLDSVAGGAAEGWMVGDAPVADVLGGHAAGLRTGWVDRGRPWGGPSLPPAVDANLRQDLRPDLVVSHVVEAIGHLLDD